MIPIDPALLVIVSAIGPILAALLWSVKRVYDERLWRAQAERDWYQDRQLQMADKLQTRVGQQPRRPQPFPSTIRQEVEKENQRPLRGRGARTPCGEGTAVTNKYRRAFLRRRQSQKALLPRLPDEQEQLLGHVDPQRLRTALTRASEPKSGIGVPKNSGVLKGTVARTYFVEEHLVADIDLSHTDRTVSSFIGALPTPLNVGDQVGVSYQSGVREWHIVVFPGQFLLERNHCERG